MTASSHLSATVLICTYNRANLLGETLDSLSRVRSARPWDVVVVDNNSTDDTRRVVQQRVAGFPVPLVYLFESQQGKSHALNAGLRHASGDILVFTDDDVQVPERWLDAACEPLDSRTIDYTGGPVRPLWDGEPPRWLDLSRTDLWGTLAILDYGPTPFVFEERRKVPLGVNMAARRALLDRVGGFDPRFGRTGRSLLGQEQAEFFSRARAAGARGLYVPSMDIEHHVPANRLTRRYFRRWWFWKGISRARLDGLHPITDAGLDLRTVPRIGGVPRFVWGLLARAAFNWVGAQLRRDTYAVVRSETSFCYALGYVRCHWARQGSLLASARATATPHLNPLAPTSSEQQSR